jgi:hypothetical protein
MGLAKKQEKKPLEPFKARVLRLTWQHLWRLKHLEGAQGLKHDVDRLTKIVDRAHCQSIDQNSRLSDNQG